jgi:hypothetical protein
VLKQMVAVGLLLAATAPSLAALPPQYQRANELSAVISATSDAFGFDGIESVEYVDVDLYRVKGAGCHVDVKIVDVPPKPGEEMVAGPRQFTTEVGERSCP